jgi:polyhydroxyalkanoate synthesis regulator phasin
MAWTEAESTRIETIETVVNQLQTAITRLASKQQLQQLMLLKQAEITSLTNRIAALERAVELLEDLV